MFADGSNGSVEFRDDHIVIRRKGLANVLTQGLQGDKSIPLSSITAVQFRPAGSMMAGLIQFTLQGGREFQGGMLEATKDENAVMFTRAQEPAFIAIRDTIQAAISSGGSSARVGGGAPADELSKLADLFERGHLTQEEFEAAKRGAIQRSTPTPRPAAITPLATPEPQKKGMTGLKMGCLAVVVIIVALWAIGSAIAPKWGEPGYRPKISDECRAVWASPNVDKDQYVRAICTPQEQHEIAGYRQDR